MGEPNRIQISQKAAVEHARNNGYNVVILDTAGRLHVDESMMEELKDQKQLWMYIRQYRS